MSGRPPASVPRTRLDHESRGTRGRHWNAPCPPFVLGFDVSGVVTQGQLCPLIDTTVPLAMAAQAHARGETNHATGKIVLSVID